MYKTDFGLLNDLGISPGVIVYKFGRYLLEVVLQFQFRLVLIFKILWAFLLESSSKFKKVTCLAGS